MINGLLLTPDRVPPKELHPSMMAADMIFVRDQTFARVESKIKPLLRGTTAERNRGKVAHQRRQFAKGRRTAPPPMNQC